MKGSHHITRILSAGLIAGALAAPGANARPPGPDAPSSGEPVVLESAPAPGAQSVDEGFDWVSAAIGAGAAGGLVLLLGVGGATFRRRGAHVDATQ